MPSERAMKRARGLARDHAANLREGCGGDLDRHAGAIARALDERGAEVVEMMLCEATRLALRPGVAYRFSADPGCGACAEALEACGGAPGPGACPDCGRPDAEHEDGCP